MSWYPLGRPVGTTIYPGMQLTSVAIFHVLEAIGRPMSLNDVCAYVPVWFGVTASLLTGALASECSGSRSAGAAAALVMSVIPAHLMRSVGGGYDNESIAVTAMCGTFYVWVRSLRTDASWPLGAAAGVAYIYMVAAWGGYVFVLNLIGAHAALLVALGRLTPKLYRAYTLFFVIGTAGAIQFPTVGLAPFKSMEQLGPLAVFLAIQVLFHTERAVKRRNLVRRDAAVFRARVFAAAALLGCATVVALIPTGYFGPLSMRVRSLFIKHTRTGNPLVDSVAEHQPTSADAYWHHLHYACYAAPLGFAALLVTGRGDAKLFLILYALIAYYFANKMNRLIILMGPVASALSGVSLGLTADWVIDSLQEGVAAATGGGALAHQTKAKKEPPAAGGSSNGAPPPTPPTASAAAREKKKERAAKAASSKAADLQASVMDTLLAPLRKIGATPGAGAARAVVAVALLALFPSKARQFWGFAQMFSEQMSQPSVVFKARLQSGETILVTDFLDSYKWLEKNTPADARILSWWDYGYQITGIANRTTLADGNTWNLEHIALIGRCLTSSELRAHKLIRHLADYVLVWSGGGGDDLAKSPHSASRASSIVKAPLSTAVSPFLHPSPRLSGAHRHLRVHRHLRRARPHVLLVRLCRRAAAADAHDGRLPAVQDDHAGLRAGGDAQLHALRGGVHLKVPKGAHLQGEPRVDGLQKVAGRPGQPAVQPRRVVLPGAVPAGDPEAAARQDAGQTQKVRRLRARGGGGQRTASKATGGRWVAAAGLTLRWALGISSGRTNS